MSKRVLMVDDEPLNREILRVFLHSLQYEVLEAICGEEAFRTLEENQVDIILLDVMMPDLSGFEVSRKLHEQPGFNTPILFLSARAQKEDMLEGKDAGGFDYLIKPFSVSQLDQKIKAALNSVQHL